jgi:hypothetical protein
MTTPRQMVIDALAPLLPDVDVVAYARNLDSLDRPTVMVAIHTVTPLPTPGVGFRTYTFELYVMTPLTTPGDADDELDATLEDLLAALDDTGQLGWSDARRGTYEDAWPAYVVTVPTYSQHTPPDTP